MVAAREDPPIQQPGEHRGSQPKEPRKGSCRLLGALKGGFGEGERKPVEQRKTAPVGEENSETGREKLVLDQEKIIGLASKEAEKPQIIEEIQKVLPKQTKSRLSAYRWSNPGPPPFPVDQPAGSPGLIRLQKPVDSMLTFLGHLAPEELHDVHPTRRKGIGGDE
jgi:hypothetical protein